MDREQGITAAVLPVIETTSEEHALSEHSLWPPILSLGLLLVGLGLIIHIALVVLGALIVLSSVVGWLWEPWTSEQEHIHKG